MHRFAWLFILNRHRHTHIRTFNLFECIKWSETQWTRRRRRRRRRRKHYPCTPAVLEFRHIRTLNTHTLTQSITNGSCCSRSSFHQQYFISFFDQIKSFFSFSLQFLTARSIDAVVVVVHRWSSSSPSTPSPPMQSISIGQLMKSGRWAINFDGNNLIIWTQNAETSSKKCHRFTFFSQTEFAALISYGRCGHGHSSGFFFLFKFCVAQKTHKMEMQCQLEEAKTERKYEIEKGWQKNELQKIPRTNSLLPIDDVKFPKNQFAGSSGCNKCNDSVLTSITYIRSLTIHKHVLGRTTKWRRRRRRRKPFISFQRPYFDVSWKTIREIFSLSVGNADESLGTTLHTAANETQLIWTHRNNPWSTNRECLLNGFGLMQAPSSSLQLELNLLFSLSLSLRRCQQIILIISPVRVTHIAIRNGQHLCTISSLL